jgi:hypothetical protein
MPTLIPNLHKDFAHPIILYHDVAPQNVTPEKIEEKLADVCALSATGKRAVMVVVTETSMIQIMAMWKI